MLRPSSVTLNYAITMPKAAGADGFYFNTSTLSTTAGIRFKF